MSDILLQDVKSYHRKADHNSLETKCMDSYYKLGRNTNSLLGHTKLVCTETVKYGESIKKTCKNYTQLSLLRSVSRERSICMCTFMKHQDKLQRLVYRRVLQLVYTKYIPNSYLLYKDKMLSVRNFFSMHVAPWFLHGLTPGLLEMKRPSSGTVFKGSRFYSCRLPSMAL